MISSISDIQDENASLSKQAKSGKIRSKNKRRQCYINNELLAQKNKCLTTALSAAKKKIKRLESKKKIQNKDALLSSIDKLLADPKKKFAYNS